MANNKVYSASDFQNAVVSMAVEDCYWEIDLISPTNIGEHSKLPLFEVELKTIRPADNLNLPEGYTDGTSLMSRNRKYFVREGRPMYNKLADIWNGVGADRQIFPMAALDEFKGIAFKGHVERLSGITYTKKGRGDISVTKSKLELWYPDEYEPGAIFEDFIYLCNKGTYVPTVEKKSKTDPIKDAINKLDPKLVEAIIAMNK